MKRRTLRNVLVFAGILFWMLWPLLSVLVASTIATSRGCQLDEGSAHPCLVLGKEVGELLYSMFVMGWFFFLTIPTGVIALVVFLVVILLQARKAGESTARE